MEEFEEELTMTTQDAEDDFEVLLSLAPSQSPRQDVGH